nr:MAG TPA: hypothetical protein [Caudoviricetes sp.]
MFVHNYVPPSIFATGLYVDCRTRRCKHQDLQLKAPPPSATNGGAFLQPAGSGRRCLSSPYSTQHCTFKA